MATSREIDKWNQVEAMQLLFAARCLFQSAKAIKRKIPAQHKGTTNGQAKQWFINRRMPERKWQRSLCRFGVMLASISSRLSTLDEMLGNDSRPYETLIARGQLTLSEREQVLRNLHWVLRDNHAHTVIGGMHGEHRVTFLSELEVVSMIDWLRRIEERVRRDIEARCMWD